MTVGLSKELLEEVYAELLEHFGEHPNDPGIKTCLEALIGNCEELNPWISVNDDTPKDRRILASCIGYKVVVANWDIEVGEFVSFPGGIVINPEYWQELPLCGGGNTK